MASDKKPRRHRREDTALHVPKRIRPHLADEYQDLGDHVTAAQLRRQLRGHENLPVSVDRRQVTS